MQIVHGFSESQRDAVAGLFWEAFSGKLGRVLAPERKALEFVSSALTPGHAISAVDVGGTVVGVAGYKTNAGGLLTVGVGDMAQVYGRFGAIWRGPLLDQMERPLAERQMLIDGIFVAAPARGRGVGSALIEAVVAEARRRGMDEVRLNVINTNLRARALYERHGFVPKGRVETGWLAWLFGFHHATTMCLPLR